MEDNRLSELIMGIRNQIGALAKEIEERTRQIPFLAEQRTSDTKRIAQLQQETVELFKRVEAVAGRLPVLEENMRKQGARIEKVAWRGAKTCANAGRRSWKRCGLRWSTASR